MLTVTCDKAVLSMCEKHPAAAVAKSGDTLVFETMDCFSNTLKTEQDMFTSVPWNVINPATGPVFIEGAHPKDALKVEIQKIEVTSDGVIVLAPKFGVFRDEIQKEVTKIAPIKDGRIRFNDKISMPIRPMIGVIGTAPADGEDIPTGTPGTHGGNMDCKEITEGVTVYLPVNVEGGMLSMGDVHAIMGDGEVSISGAECAAKITVRVTVLKQPNLPMPLVENDSHYMTVYTAPTLDQAADGAVIAMKQFLTDELGMEYYDAVMLVSVAADLKICQIVDPLITCRMELPKEVVKEYGMPKSFIRE